MKYMVAPSYKYAEIVKIDEENHKAYIKEKCDRCSGHGIIASRIENGHIVPIPVDGGICYKCGGSGIVSKWVKAYTEKEYAQYLRAQERARERKKEKEEARLQAKKDILGTKQEFIDKAYTIAQEAILAMPEDEYIDLLAKKACDASVSGEEAVVLNEDDKSALGQKVVEAANALLAAAGKKASLVLSDETANMTGGLFLKQNDVSVNCSIDSIIGTFREDMDIKVAKVLFG